MKLGIVVDLNPNVKNRMRTHLKTAPKPQVDDVIIRQARKFFIKNLIKIYQIEALLMVIKDC